MLKILGILLLVASSVASPQDRRSIMVAQYQGPGGNRIIEVSPEGKVVWEHKVPSLCVMFQMLPNEHVVSADGRLAHLVYTDGLHLLSLFEGYIPGAGAQPLNKEIAGDMGTFHLLAWKGRTRDFLLLGEQGPCQAVEVSPAGDVVATVKLPTTEKPYHQQLRNIHRLENGNVLAAIEAEGAAREVTPEGKVVWEVNGLANVFEAIRLPDGNTLVACGTQKRVIEVSPAGKVVRELMARDVPEVNLTWVTSLQVLKNGNYLIGNFLHGQEGKGAHAFEVTRDKKVVWTFADHALVKSATMVRAIESR